MQVVKKILKKFLFFLFGVIAGMIITMIFNPPIVNFLVKYRIFYYLDLTKPEIEELIPNINEVKDVNRGTRLFRLRIYEIGSGVNNHDSYLKIFHKHGEDLTELDGELEIKASVVNLILVDGIDYGKYVLDGKVVDNANNEVPIYHEFYVREKNDLVVYVDIQNYEKYPLGGIRKKFGDFISQKDYLEFNNVFIYDLILKNKAVNLTIRDLFLNIDAGGIIYKMLETRHDNVNGIQIILLGEQVAKLRVNQSPVYLSQATINIGRIAPHGYSHFAILVQGFPRGLPQNMKHGHINIFASYTTDGYGSREFKKLEKTIDSQKFY